MTPCDSPTGRDPLSPVLSEENARNKKERTGASIFHPFRDAMSHDNHRLQQNIPQAHPRCGEQMYGWPLRVLRLSSRHQSGYNEGPQKHASYFEQRFKTEIAHRERPESLLSGLPAGSARCIAPAALSWDWCEGMNARRRTTSNLTGLSGAPPTPATLPESLPDPGGIAGDGTIWLH